MLKEKKIYLDFFSPSNYNVTEVPIPKSTINRWIWHLMWVAECAVNSHSQVTQVKMMQLFLWLTCKINDVSNKKQLALFCANVLIPASFIHRKKNSICLRFMVRIKTIDVWRDKMKLMVLNSIFGCALSTVLFLCLTQNGGGVSCARLISSEPIGWCNLRG